MSIIPDLSATRPLVDEDGMMTQQTRSAMNKLTSLGIIEGSGSPESVISAGVTALYMDTAGSAGSILYIKKLAAIGGDDTQGWILV